jgi:hypothetical protein
LLLLQLQRCSKPLPARATAAGAAAGTGAFSHSGSACTTVGAACVQAFQIVYQLQLSCGMMLYELAGIITNSMLEPAVRDQIEMLLRDPATAELLLQLLAVHTVLLHRILDAEQQQLRSGSMDCSSSNACGVGALGAQHQHSQRMQSSSPAAQQFLGGSSNSGSSSSSSSGQAPRQHLQAFKSQPPEVALGVKALQNGMMQLLPGGCQQYVGAAAAHAAGQAARYGDSRKQQVEQQITRAGYFVYALFCSLEITFHDVPAEQQPGLNARRCKQLLCT